jgi:hypothetical protein
MLKPGVAMTFWNDFLWRFYISGQYQMGLSAKGFFKNVRIRDVA